MPGLSEAESLILNQLADRIEAKRPRNELRQRWMDGKRSARILSPMLPPYLRNTGAALGWPAKAVEALARRTHLDAFAIPGSDLSAFGLDRIIDDNRYMEEVRESHIDSLSMSVVFEVVTRGGEGEPDALITAKSALDATGGWNGRTRRLDSFLSVIGRADDGKPADMNLYLPGETIIIEGRRVVDRSTHQLWVPAHPVAYKRRLTRPFGQSRISRSVMWLTEAAIRAMLRMEGTADFYSVPMLVLLGATLEQMSQEGQAAVSTWQFLMDRINGIPDDDGAEQPRAEVKQLSQATQQPHMDQLDEIAAAFAGETGIPVSSLGIGVKQANPTSADSYMASREDLIAEAEDAADSWGPEHVRTLQDAWLLASGEAVLPPELRKLRPVWRDARLSSRAAAADATAKLVGAFPWMADSDAILDAVGLDPMLVERLRADKAKSAARASLLALTGGAPNATVQG